MVSRTMVLLVPLKLEYFLPKFASKNLVFIGNNRLWYAMELDNMLDKGFGP
jgi:hypothetical protein